ncbi:MAG: peptidoglycan-associated lipoprotein Pal [bacterium]
MKELKFGALLVLLAALVTGCASSSSTEGSGTTVGGDSDSVATGTVSGGGVVSGVADLATRADVIFYFDFDQSTLRPEAKAALRMHAETLRAKPRPIRLEGHADERGTREYNMALGERRANAVKEFLVLEGVNGSYLEVISYGEEAPAVVESSDRAWALNRRVEMK